MKIACLPGARRKSAGLPLNIAPVGDPGAGWLGALATMTVPVPLMGTMCAAPVASMAYSVEVPPALFATHQGVPLGPDTKPQAFCRFGSMTPADAGEFPASKCPSAVRAREPRRPLESKSLTTFANTVLKRRSAVEM